VGIFQTTIIQHFKIFLSRFFIAAKIVAISERASGNSRLV